MGARKRIEYGQYIVADPKIYHGQLTFKGTRIPVKIVLFYVAKGYDWDWISNSSAESESNLTISAAPSTSVSNPNPYCP